VEKELLDEARNRMAKAVTATQTEFNTVRSGRASTALLDRIHVDYYGASTPLKQMASLSAPEARLLTVTPYDKSSIKAIEKAIMESDIGINPSNDGQIIRLPVPTLTEERRRELVKLVHRLAEDGRVAVRNIRRDILKDLKEAKTEGLIGEDTERRAEEQLQKATNDHVRQIDELLKRKEQEILEV
jgi:ribosome recycling factor